jgi:hypothetical protein
MTGSTEIQSNDIDDFRRSDFDAYCAELEADHDRESEWLYENEPLSPRLTAMCTDLWMQLNQAVQRRRYRHSREWL